MNTNPNPGKDTHNNRNKTTCLGDLKLPNNKAKASVIVKEYNPALVKYKNNKQYIRVWITLVEPKLKYRIKDHNVQMWDE